MKSRLYVSSAIALALVLAYGGASWYAGQQAQVRIDQAIEEANLQLATTWPGQQDRATLRVRDYQRGWFRSSIEYAFAFKDEDGREHVLRMQDDLQHGPFPWRAVSAGRFAPLLASSRVRLLPTEAVQVWFDSQQGASPLQIDTAVSFGGKAHSLWQFHPAKLAHEDTQIDFSGGRVEVEFDQELKTSTASGHFEFLSWVDEAAGERGEFRNMTFEGRNAIANQEDMQTHNLVKAEQIIVTQEGQPALALERVEVKLDSARRGGLLDGTLGYAFGAVRLGDAQLGQLQAGMRVEHLDVEAFKALLSAWERMSAALPDDEALSTADERLLREKIQVLVASRPSVAIGPLKWKNTQGESQASLAIHFMPASEDAAGDGVVNEAVNDEDLGTLLERSLRQVQFSLSISKPMLVQAVAQLNEGADPDKIQALASMLFDHYTAGMQRAGLLEVKDGVASVNVSYQAGEVTLGVATMSVGEFIALVQGMMG